MQRPAERYHRSARRYTDHPAPVAYPRHYEVRRVRSSGIIQWRNQGWYIGQALHRMAVGLTEVDEGRWAVYFGDLLLGYVDTRIPGSLQPVAPPAPGSTG